MIDKVKEAILTRLNLVAEEVSKALVLHNELEAQMNANIANHTSLLGRQKELQEMLAYLYDCQIEGIEPSKEFIETANAPIVE